MKLFFALSNETHSWFAGLNLLVTIPIIFFQLQSFAQPSGISQRINEKLMVIEPIIQQKGDDYRQQFLQTWVSLPPEDQEKNVTRLIQQFFMEGYEVSAKIIPEKKKKNSPTEIPHQLIVLVDIHVQGYGENDTFRKCILQSFQNETSEMFWKLECPNNSEGARHISAFIHEDETMIRKTLFQFLTESHSVFLNLELDLAGAEMTRHYLRENLTRTSPIF